MFKSNLHPLVHCSIVYSSQDMEATQVFTDAQMDVENVCTSIYYTHVICVYIYVYIYMCVCIYIYIYTHTQ